MSPLETPISPVKGTEDRLPADLASLTELESLLLERFARAGYERLSTPVLEPVELHDQPASLSLLLPPLSTLILTPV